MNHPLRIAGPACLLSLILTPPLLGQSWSDNFDSYAADSSLQDQGGWEVPSGSPFFAAFVVNFVAHSPPNSMQTIALTNTVRQLDVSSGRWTLTAWQLFISRSLFAPTYLIINNEFIQFGQATEAMRYTFSPDGFVFDELNPSTKVPLVVDAWAEIRMEIDLDRNHVDAYYNGQLFSSRPWTIAGGPAAIDAVNVLSNGLVIIYDDFSLAPAAVEGDLNGDGDVDGFDLAQLLAAWGLCSPSLPGGGPGGGSSGATASSCPADLDGNGVVDGVVDGVDLALLLGAWS